jgi:hypothetical protein
MAGAANGFQSVGRSEGRLLRWKVAAAAIGSILALALLLGLSANLAVAASQTFFVNDTSDMVDARVGQNGCRTAANTCTLRAAIQEANATSDPDVIQLPAGFFAITIRGNSNTQGDFDITRPLTIVGVGAGTIVDGGQPPSGSPPDRRGLDRVLEIQSSAGNVTLAGMTIQEGYTAEMGGGILHGSSGTLRLENLLVRGNYAGKYGGGLNNVRSGRVQLIGTTFSGNAAVEGGSALNNAANGTIEILENSHVSDNPGTYPLLAGAIHNEGQNDAVGAILVRDSQVSDNHAIREGAGISNDGDGNVVVERSNITGNRTSSSGGGIYTVSGTLRVIDASTISDNHAGNLISTGNGGGIYNVGALTKAGMAGRVEIAKATISFNTATGDGGGFAGGLESDLTLVDSIVSGNVAESDGGGISSQSKASVSITRVQFADNTAAVRAGGVYSHTGGESLIVDSTFTENESLEEGGAGLYTDGSGALTVRRTMFSENTAVGDGGGVAIHSSGVVSINDSDILDNESHANGGGLENSGGLVTLTDVRITDNEAALDGGGIHNTSSGEFTILDTTVEENTAENGGGFANVSDSTLVVRRSLFSDNEAVLGLRSDSALGGGIYSISDGSSLFENSTVSGNSAEVAGGGIYHNADGSLALVHVTVTDNSAPRGAGFALEVAAPTSTQVVVRNTIIAANDDGADCDGGLLSEGGNIDGGSACQFHGPGDLHDTDPGLADLGDYGGPTHTHALNPGSPAINGGVGACPLTDQRRFARPPSACDIGAYELGGSVTEPPECVPGTVAIPAEADSWVFESSPTSNYGDDTVLKVDSKLGNNARALVRFALEPSIPSGCGVVSAALRLYAASYKEDRTLEAATLEDDWTEEGVTWETQPATDEDAEPATSPSGLGYLEWNVTSQVQEMDADDNHGFLIRDAVEDGGGLDQGFLSREKVGDATPQLVVAFG